MGGFGGDIPTLDLSFDFDTYLKRAEKVSKDPLGAAEDDPRLLLAPDLLSSMLVKSPQEIESDKGSLLSKVRKPPSIPTSDDERVRQAKEKAANREKRRRGRAASIKTGSRGLEDIDDLGIARATLTG
jgi:hypothetical protein